MSKVSKEEMFAIEPKIWIGLVAVFVYVLLAAGLGNLVNAVFPTGSELGDFALSHFIPLPILIIAGLLFIKRAGWGKQVWTAVPAHKQQSRRLWLYAFPILLAIQALIPLTVAEWNHSSFILLATVLVATAMVGFGEELYVRGILRFSIRAHHGAFLTLLITSLVFGLAHTASGIFNGFEPAFIIFEVSALMLTGASYYGAFLATGRLWVVMVLHFMTDFGLYLAGGFEGTANLPLGTPTAVVGTLIMGFTAALAISMIRQDITEKRVKAQSISK